jgi:hypothetical protein
MSTFTHASADTLASRSLASSPGSHGPVGVRAAESTLSSADGVGSHDRAVSCFGAGVSGLSPIFSRLGFFIVSAPFFHLFPTQCAREKKKENKIHIRHEQLPV